MIISYTLVEFRIYNYDYKLYFGWIQNIMTDTVHLPIGFVQNHNFYNIGSRDVNWILVVGSFTKLALNSTSLTSKSILRNILLYFNDQMIRYSECSQCRIAICRIAICTKDPCDVAIWARMRGVQQPLKHEGSLRGSTVDASDRCIQRHTEEQMQGACSLDLKSAQDSHKNLIPLN